MIGGREQAAQEVLIFLMQQILTSMTPEYIVLNYNIEHLHNIDDSATIQQNNYIETVKTRINHKLILLMSKLEDNIEDNINVQALLSGD